MENIIERKNQPFESFDLSKIYKSKFLYFLIAFIALIISADHYNNNPLPEQKSIITATSTVKEKPSSALQEEIIEFAKSQLGRQYTAAGKSPSEGFDCSGFTYYVYKNFDIEIPSSSLTQSMAGEAVDVADAQKGDLIFFKSPTVGNEQIGHVGIVLSNHNGIVEFIHSSTKRGVVINDLESKHYKERFRTIRRVI